MTKLIFDCVEVVVRPPRAESFAAVMPAISPDRTRATLADTTDGDYQQQADADSDSDYQQPSKGRSKKRKAKVKPVQRVAVVRPRRNQRRAPSALQQQQVQPEAQQHPQELLPLPLSATVRPAAVKAPVLVDIYAGPAIEVVIPTLEHDGDIWVSYQMF